MGNRGGWVARAGWLAVFIGPPAVAAVLLRRAIAGHEASAVVLGLVYECVVAGVRFAGGVVGDLANRWRERLVERADLILQRQVSRFDGRYREFVLADVRFIDLKGLATVGYFTPELDEVFIDVSLAFRAPHKVPIALLPDLPDVLVGVTERRALGEFLDRPEPEVLAVIGAPGSGKTTLLRHTARQVCLARRHRRRRVPMLLYLRDHAADIVARPSVAVADLLRGTLGQTGASEPDGWFEQRLHDGDCVVLLDGLDEVARQEDRGNVAAWVERQIRQYPRNDYVITSRPYGYRTARIDGASVLQVRDFTSGQVTRFVRGWYAAVARHDAGADGQDSMRRARSAADDLLQRLAEAPGLDDLTVNPLLLTMIVNVHRDGGSKLPGSRAELYGEICQVVLWRRQEAKKLIPDMDGAEKEAVLRGLAYTMMQRRLRDLPRDDVLAEIRPALKRASRQVTPEDFLADVGSNGLLVERESGQYHFAHHTFQEYLAAAYIRDKGLAGDVAKNVDDAWWRETTLLYAALADANLIVRACLSSASVGAVTLAFDCADQGSLLAPGMLGSLEDLINGAAAPGADPDRRRLFAGVLLARHLRQQIRAGDAAHVCTRPITTALYQLFLEDGQHPAPDGPTPGSPGDEAASGMRASDAAAFVGWVNGIIGGGRVYRLPSRAEVDDTIRQRLVSAPPPAASNRSTWLASDHALPELWVPPGAPHPCLIEAETLAAHVEYDFTGAVPTLTRLLLLRSVVRIRALARDLDRARRLFRSSDVASVLARKGALHDISNAPARDISRALSLSLGSDPIGGTARVLTRVLTRALAPDDDLTFANELDPDGARASYLGRAHTRALDLVSALDLALQRDLARTDALAHALSLDRERGTGKALSHALSQALPGITGHNWPAVFSHAFINTAGVTGNSFVISPDTMTGKLSTAAQALAIGTPSGKTQRSAWTVEVASRFQRTAAAVFDRREQLTPAAATSIRLAALCLGVEADELGQHMLGRTFREIAAGVTLLERRASGQAPATETILLATD